MTEETIRSSIKSI